MSTHKIKTPQERKQLIGFIEKLNPEKVWIVEVKQYRQRRTLPQNRLIHLWFACIARETGNNLEDIKDYFKRKFLPLTIISVFGDQMEAPMRTRDLDTKQMADFANMIDSDVSTEGMKLPYPADKDFEHFYSEFKDFIG